ncbi:TetR/AcrR family transcriptional regulator [Gulosibacter molinativorax]|uniref:TetR/AcrR family transcriptional regulator n=1 Tax=Gulosibacter molinativorax TaxID=256821 RepID=A0ABT7C9N3_9MICO|nr:TetR/AcrR family transcriptional regulator [Gulosibacter molinativorax]MDJ1371918.1 TetR/AcrR family transcriptional regulator [Gulosibacter molinativorax]QUY62567.1 Hypotetical protein [Gulosibacter molinativorax]
MNESRRAVGRPRTRLLNREGITQAARQILLSRGDEGLTMTSLAKELGVTPSALYNHASSKLEILAWVQESVFSEIDYSAVDSKPWAEALEDWAHSYLDVAVKHRKLLQALPPILPADRPGTWPMYERIVSALVEGGWPIESCVSVIEALEAYIYGCSVREPFHAVDIDNPELNDTAPTYRAALAAREDDGVAAEKDALFRIGFSSILTWSAEQLGVTLDAETAPHLA